MATAVSRRVIGSGTNVPDSTLLSLLARYPDNSSVLLHGFGLAPLSLPRSRLRTFQYFLALLLYVLRFEWLPTPDSALPTGVVRFGGTMASADSRQTDYPAALSRFSRGSQDKACSFHTVQAEFTMRTHDRVSGVSIQGCLTSCALAFLFGFCSSCLCFASGFFPTPHYYDAVAFGYLIPPCQRLIADSHPSYVSCLTYHLNKARSIYSLP